MIKKASKKKSKNLLNTLPVGVKYMLIATLAFTLMQTVVKHLKPLHTFEITFFRSAITSLCCFIYLAYYRLPFIGNNQKILIARAFLGIISMTAFFFTLQWMPFGASVSLKYLSPIFAAIVAVLFLKEKIKRVQWLFLGMALAGVILLKGYDNRISIWGLGIGLLGAIAGGLIYPLIRRIGKSEHPMVIINYFMFIATILLGLLMLPYWTFPTTNEWLLLLLMGFAGFWAQVFMTKAFQAGEVNMIAPLKYLEVIYALLIGLIWYGEKYALLSFLGIVLILGGTLLNLRFKWQR